MEDRAGHLSMLIKNLIEYIDFVIHKTILGGQHFAPYIFTFTQIPPPKDFDTIIQGLYPGKPDSLADVRHDLLGRNVYRILEVMHIDFDGINHSTVHLERSLQKWRLEAPSFDKVKKSIQKSDEEKQLAKISRDVVF